MAVVHFQVKSQNNNVGIGTLNPDPSAVLELQSSSKGFKLPTVNSPGAILNPVEGLLVFSDTDKKLFIYSNGQWTPYISSNNLFANQVPSLSSSGYLQPSGIISDPILGINLYSMIIKSDKIGIRNGSAINFIPDELFHVDGKTKTNQLQIVHGAGNGRILQSDANGNASWKEPNTIPLQETDPQVNTFILNMVPRNSGLALIDGSIYDDGTKIVIGNDFFSNAKLSVTGKTKTNEFQMTEGGSVNKIMSSDAEGNASWIAPGTVETDPQVNVPTHLLGAVPNWNGTSLVEGILYDNGVTVQINGNSGTNAPPGLNVIGTTQLNRLQIPLGAAAGSILRSVDNLGNASWIDPFSIQTLELDPQVLCLVPGKIPRFNGQELVDGLINDYGTSVEIGTNLTPNQFFKVYGNTETNGLRLINGAVAGHILTSNSSGNASWVAPGTIEIDPQVSTSILNTVPRWTGTTLSNGVIKDDSANVGIGTDPVSTQKLTVNGKTTTSNLQITAGANTGLILSSDAFGNASWSIPANVEQDPQVSMTNTNYYPVWNGTTLVDAIMGQNGNEVIVEGNISSNTSTSANFKMTTGAGAGKILQSDLNGNASWVSPVLVFSETDPKVATNVTNIVPRWNGSNLANGSIQDDGVNIGVGTAPVGNQKLTVAGTTTTSNLQVTTGAANGLLLRSDADGYGTWVTPQSVETDPQVNSAATGRVPRWSGTALSDGTIQDDATNVGIGTAPVANQKLTVDGKTVTTNLQMTTGAVNGRILQSDASGNGTWVNSTTLSITETDPQVSSSATGRVPRWSGTALSDGTIQDDATNIGIGTAPVANQKLTVSGKTTTTNLQMTTGAATGLILQSDASGNGAWVNANTLTTNNLYNTSGSINSARTITQDNNALTITNNGTQNTAINLTSTGDFMVQKNGTNVLMVNDNGKVGINTSAPSALLHVADSSVVFTGLSNLPLTPGNPPISGTGTRMMWYPDKAAFRAGNVSGTQWDKINTGSYSMAFGLQVKASGFSSTAMGQNTTASGDGSTSMGSGTLASNIASTAMGQNTQALGWASTAMGGVTQALGLNSTAMGHQTIAFGEASVAMGSNTLADGTYSVAMGTATTAEESSSVAMGVSTLASGILTIATGFASEARAYSSLSVGRYNDPIVTSSKTTWVTTDPVFIIGNGTSHNDRKNAITILKNAKTGINTSAPLAGLHIKGVEASFDSHIRLETAGGGEYGNILYDGNMKFRNFGADDEYQWRNSANNIRMRLFDNGDLTIAGTLTTGSDARLKKDIKPINNALSVISGINGYTYQWVDESRGSLLQSGVIAQEIEGSLPHLVRTNEADEKSVNYTGMIPYLIEAVKDLKKENEELKKLVEKLLEEKK